jgi:uncharacterized protein YndB with AHSA1/START domain
MPSYNFATFWIFAAPIESVWSALIASERWPEWWPYLEAVVQVAPGDSAGIGAIHRYSWRGPLPYRLTFEMVVTRIERPFVLGGSARGDLEGTGQWTLSAGENGTTRVRYDWNVRTTIPWMNLLAPFARGLFARNHGLVMRAGREGLSRHLGKGVIRTG